MRSTAKYWEHVGPMKRGAAAEPARHGINDVHELNGGSGTAGASPANLARELRAALAMLDETQRTDLGRAAALAMRVVDLGQRCADTRLLADALAAAAHVFASRDEEAFYGRRCIDWLRGYLDSSCSNRRGVPSKRAAC